MSPRMMPHRPLTDTQTRALVALGVDPATTIQDSLQWEWRAEPWVFPGDVRFHARIIYRRLGDEEDIVRYLTDAESATLDEAFR